MSFRADWSQIRRKTGMPASVLIRVCVLATGNMHSDVSSQEYLCYIAGDKTIFLGHAIVVEGYSSCTLTGHLPQGKICACREVSHPRLAYATGEGEH